MPLVMDHLWRHSIADHFIHSVLKDMGFADIEHIITATNAPFANNNNNY